MRRKTQVVLSILFALSLSMSLPACNLFSTDEVEISVEERAQTMVAETLAVELSAQTIVAATLTAASTQEEPQPEATEVPTPTATAAEPTPVPPTPTRTLTPTSSVPMVMVSVDTNCRTGPGQPYDIIGALMVGEQAEVVGAAVGGGYWIIKNPDRAGDCWLWANYASVVGQTTGLPMYTPPPTPTPVYNWTGTWTTSWGVPSQPHQTYIITFTQTNASVSGSFTVGTLVVTLSGTLSTDYMTLTGTWNSTTETGPFVFKLINANQFIGNMNSGTYEWCGYRAGAGLPSSCMGP